MAITAHVYQIFIAADPAQVWTAITDSEWTRRYFHGTSFDAPPKAGEPYATSTADGRPAVEGSRRRAAATGRGRAGPVRPDLAHALRRARWPPSRPSRVEWTVEAVGDGLTRVRLVHGDLAFSPLTWANVKDGWVWILDSMKSLLETGQALPPVSRDAVRSSTGRGTTPTGTVRKASRRTTQPVGPVRQVRPGRPTRTRTCSAGRTPPPTTGSAPPTPGPENEGRANYMIAKALLLTGQPEAVAPRSADRSMAVCEGEPTGRLRPRVRTRGAGPRAAGARSDRRGGRGVGPRPRPCRSPRTRTARFSSWTSPTSSRPDARMPTVWTIRPGSRGRIVHTAEGPRDSEAEPGHVGRE